LNAALIDLIGAIYDAAIEPQLWQSTIDRIRQHFGFHIAMLGIAKLPEVEMLIQVSCNVPAEYVAAVPSFSDCIFDLWGGPAGVARLPLEEPVLNSNMPEFQGHESNRYYQEWAKPQGLVDQCVIFLAHDRLTNASLGLGIHESGTRPTPAQLDELRLIGPHLRRAATVSRLLDLAVDATTTFRSAFDAMSCGAVLVDAQLKILHANRVAEEMLHYGDPIRTSAGRLELHRELLPGQLKSAVSAIAAGEAVLGRRGIAIPARRRDETAVALHVMPLERRSSRAGLPLEAVAAVFIADGSGPISAPRDAVMLLYGLTPAEARVFELVAAGRSSPEIAAELGIAASTVRTHLLRVFDKTGRHRRTELVRLAGEIRVPI
jgi:DNA-binding CsgD family transcriptional regulator/PAS domain-containing protein